MKLFGFLFLFFVLSFAILAQEDPTGGDTAPAPAASAEAVEVSPEPSPETQERPAEPAARTESVAQEIIGSVESGIAGEEADGIHTKGFLLRFGVALGIIAVQILLFWLVWGLFKRISAKVRERGGEKIKPLTIKKVKVFTTKQIVDILLILLNIAKYVVSFFQLLLTVPIVFKLFPATEDLASTLFGFILHPLRNIGIGLLDFIPNLFTIAIIIIITRYALKGLKFFSNQISKGKLVLPGFYADWAEPTFNILRVLILAFTVALVYPYLPGSDTKVFQGVSVLVGVIFSFGSSTAIGNLVAGLVITYMRPFKIGDRVKIQEITGFVEEKTLMVIRLRTHKNEFVTFPNLTILNTGIVNYTTSSDDRTEGLILNTEITIGYATPWQTVHEILIKAALATSHVQKKPKPFVLQTGLDDFYARYQINCYTKEIDRVPAIYAQLYENIQDGFAEAGIDLTSPHFEISIGRKE